MRDGNRIRDAAVMTPDPVGEWMAANGLYPGRYMIDIAKSPEYRRAVFGDMTDGEIRKALPALCAKMLGREKFAELVSAILEEKKSP